MLWLAFSSFEKKGDRESFEKGGDGRVTPFITVLLVVAVLPLNMQLLLILLTLFSDFLSAPICDETIVAASEASRAKVDVAASEASRAKIDVS